MPDSFNTDEKTSKRMRSIKTSNTDIEKKVRSLLHGMGLRFRLKNTHLCGRPDIILPKYKSVVFVNGCFWHGHKKCRKGRMQPKKNVDFWKTKIENNKKRDIKIKEVLESMGWNVLLIWECEIKTLDALKLKLKNYFKL